MEWLYDAFSVPTPLQCVDESNIIRRKMLLQIDVVRVLQSQQEYTCGYGSTLYKHFIMYS